jgi:LmbE family N-acetylglucosaminyl deacetylase
VQGRSRDAEARTARIRKNHGCHRRVLRGYVDTELTCSRELINYLEGIAQKIQTDFGFIPYPDDTHQDHRALTQAAIPGSRSLIKNVLYYDGLSTQNFIPSVYVDIEDVFETKLACLEAHRSQVMNT